MTIPIERTWSVLNTRGFLLELIDPKKTPRIPSKLRKQARQLLKHYPSEFDMQNCKDSFDDYSSS